MQCDQLASGSCYHVFPANTFFQTVKKIGILPQGAFSEYFLSAIRKVALKGFICYPSGAPLPSTAHDVVLVSVLYIAKLNLDRLQKGFKAPSFCRLS